MGVGGKSNSNNCWLLNSKTKNDSYLLCFYSVTPPGQEVGRFSSSLCINRETSEDTRNLLVFVGSHGRKPLHRWSAWGSRVLQLPPRDKRAKVTAAVGVNKTFTTSNCWTSLQDKCNKGGVQDFGPKLLPGLHCRPSTVGTLTHTHRVYHHNSLVLVTHSLEETTICVSRWKRAQGLRERSVSFSIFKVPSLLLSDDTEERGGGRGGGGGVGGGKGRRRWGNTLSSRLCCLQFVSLTGTFFFFTSFVWVCLCRKFYCDLKSPLQEKPAQVSQSKTYN